MGYLYSHWQVSEQSLFSLFLADIKVPIVLSLFLYIFLAHALLVGVHATSNHYGHEGMGLGPCFCG
jgi:hypothetical protein